VGRCGRFIRWGVYRSSEASHGTHERAGSLTQRYSYDAVDRLSRIQYLQAAGTASEQLLERIDYQYDAKGQRVGKNTLNNHGSGQGETPMQASYDAANRLQSITLKPSADASSHKTY